MRDTEPLRIAAATDGPLDLPNHLFPSLPLLLDVLLCLCTVWSVLKMRVRTLVIRWHDSKPISTCDFQPAPFKKARPAQDKQFPAQAYRLATGGEDNHVRVSVHVTPSTARDTQREGYATWGPANAAMDGPPEHLAPIPGRGHVRSPCAAAATRRVPRDAQQALRRSERRPLQSERWVPSPPRSSLSPFTRVRGR